uniref:Uncharacterized protein n=1 Tax=Arundo donax TaxID=35708 RepID=A0A0A8YZD5_ARUDO
MRTPCSTSARPRCSPPPSPSPPSPPPSAAPSTGPTPRCLLWSRLNAPRPVPAALRPPQPRRPRSRTFRTGSSRSSRPCCPTTRSCPTTLTSRPPMSAPRLRSWRPVACRSSSMANCTSCLGTQIGSRQRRCTGWRGRWCHNTFLESPKGTHQRST